MDTETACSQNRPPVLLPGESENLIIARWFASIQSAHCLTPEGPLAILENMEQQTQGTSAVIFDGHTPITLNGTKLEWSAGPGGQRLLNIPKREDGSAFTVENAVFTNSHLHASQGNSSFVLGSDDGGAIHMGNVKGRVITTGNVNVQCDYVDGSVYSGGESRMTNIHVAGDAYANGLSSQVNVQVEGTATSSDFAKQSNGQVKHAVSKQSSHQSNGEGLVALQNLRAGQECPSLPFGSLSREDLASMGESLNFKEGVTGSAASESFSNQRNVKAANVFSSHNSRQWNAQ